VAKLGAPGQLWLYRTKPQEDELFSSWLVRLAAGLAIKLQSLCVQILGLRPGFLSTDVDRDPNLRLLAVLSEATATPLDRAKQTALSAYAGYLWAAHPSSRGALPWVIPISRRGRRGRNCGVQYCRRCLAEDKEPYFRRRWRLAFNVVCERHREYLRDACATCGAPVEFHAADFGVRLLPFECAIAFCPRCGADLRLDADHRMPRPKSELIEFQQTLNDALRYGWSASLPGAEPYSFLFFEGLRHVARLTVSRGRAGRLRNLLLAGRSEFAFDVNSRRSAACFEELGHGERTLAMELCAELLSAWPYGFVNACRQSRVSSSYIHLYRDDVPYWLHRELKWELNDLDYSATPDERFAAAEFLRRRGLAVNDYAVAKLLGTRRPTGASDPADSRWNPRGSGSGEEVSR